MPVTLHTLLCGLGNTGRCAAKGLSLFLQWSQEIVRSEAFDEELQDMDATAVEMMPFLKTAFAQWKDFNKSNNWHKALHGGKLYAFLGRFRGSLSDEHPEARQKLGARTHHTAARDSAC